MSKRSIIDSVEVKNACSEDWNTMKGSEKIRFCDHCSHHVNNISALTRKQAMKLVRESGGKLCVHYIKNPVDNKPVFADKLYKITRRAGIAAGVLSASLSLSTLAYAQNEAVETVEKTQVELSSEKTPDTDRTANLSGVVTNPLQKTVPFAFLTLLNQETQESFTVKADEQGAYKFENLAAGNYRLTASGGPGFAKTEAANIQIQAGDAVSHDVSLQIDEPAVVTITNETPNYDMIDGLMVSIQYISPLHRAVSDDDVEEVKNLIARGANINSKDENYSHITPLFLAVENGNAEIAATLLGFGAKINAKDDNRQTPLMRLDEDASPELVNLLFKHGAKANLTDNEGNNALILAARDAQTEVLQILMTRTANIDARNSAGRSALMEAADADNLENVRALILAGANVNLKDADGETALDLTTDEKVQELLTEYGAVSGNASDK